MKLKKTENEILHSASPIFDKVYSNKALKEIKEIKNHKPDVDLKEYFKNKQVELSLCNGEKVTGVVSKAKIGKDDNKLHSLTIVKDEESIEYYGLNYKTIIESINPKDFCSLKFIETA